MCGRFETKPNAEGLVKQLEQLNIELIIEKEEPVKKLILLRLKK
jgi:hypothetical protein